MEQAGREQQAAALESWLGDIYAYFRRLGVDAASAEDLVQEAFLIAWQDLARLRDPRKVRRWLYGIAYRCFLQHRRKSAARATVELPEELASAQWADPGSDASLQMREMWRALQSLPESYRHPLLLIFWEDLSYLEAARALSLPLGTLAWRVHKGLQLLRDALAKKGAHDEILCPTPATRAIDAPAKTRIPTAGRSDFPRP